MPAPMQEFLRWLEARGVSDDRLEAYRECAWQILNEAGDVPVEPEHVEAARQSLEAAGARPRTLAHLRDVGDALRRFQRGEASPPASARKPLPEVVAVEPTPGARPPYLLWGLLAAVVLAGGVAVFAYVGETDAPGASVASPERPTPAMVSPGEREVRAAYAAFEAAMAATDLARLRALAAEEQLADLTGPGADEKLQLAAAMYPQDAKIERVTVTGDSAVVTARARVMDQKATGRIALVQQGGAWKIAKAEWSVKMGEPEPEREVVRQADFPRLIGTWKGRETASVKWTPKFGPVAKVV